MGENTKAFILNLCKASENKTQGNLSVLVAVENALMLCIKGLIMVYSPMQVRNDVICAGCLWLPPLVTKCSLLHNTINTFIGNLQGEKVNTQIC